MFDLEVETEFEIWSEYCKGYGSGYNFFDYAGARMLASGDGFGDGFETQKGELDYASGWYAYDI